MAQSLARLHVHVVFSTKNREAFLANVSLRGEMHAYLASVLKAHGSPAVLVGGTADHVHLLCDLSRTHAVADVVREAKRSSSRWAKTKGQSLGAFQWQKGYGAFAVSFSNVPQVCAYLENQDEHHERTSFQDEFRAFLRKHGIEFDEGYVWD